MRARRRSGSMHGACGSRSGGTQAPCVTTGGGGGAGCALSGESRSAPATCLSAAGGSFRFRVAEVRGGWGGNGGGVIRGLVLGGSRCRAASPHGGQHRTGPNRLLGGCGGSPRPSPSPFPPPPGPVMADLILNVDFAPSERPGKKETGNRKHKSFLQRRRTLERRGVLKQKQLPVAQPPPGRGSRQKPGPRGRRDKKQEAATRKGPEKPTSIPPKPCPKVNGPPSIAQPGATSCPGSKGTGLSSKPKTTAWGTAKRNQKAPSFPPQPTKLVAIDCEMVGTGPGGRTSDLARCSIVGYQGDIMYDQYIRPTAPIVDYRTRWSGIRRQHMVNAIPFSKAQREVCSCLRFWVDAARGWGWGAP